MTYGTIAVDSVSTSSGQILGAGNATGFKNRIINGAMVIDQRNSGASNTPSTTAAYTYYIDRWAYNNSQASKLTYGQNLNSATPPSGFTNYFGVQVASTATVGSSDYFLIEQSIEGYNIADLAWGTSSGKTVTLSFWVQSSLTGTFGGSILNNGTTESYPFSYSIPTANTWTYCTVTILAPPVGTTWLTNNGRGMFVYFSMGIGSTFQGPANTWAAANYGTPTGAVSILGTSGATFYITGVQLEVGSTATSFDVRDYGRELILCQRYYQFGGAGSVGLADGTSSGRCSLGQNTIVSMRTTPTINLTSGVYISVRYQGSDQGATSPTISFSNTSATGWIAGINGFSTSLTSGNAVVERNGNNIINLSAEL